MQKAEINIGDEYGLRESPRAEAPMQRIRILEHIRGTKWRAQWLDPNPGLEDYVESRHLVVRWKERKQFLRDEENNRILREHNLRTGYDHDDSPVPSAVLQVFECVADDVGFYRGALTASAEALSRVRARSRLEASRYSTVAYTDRHGRVHLPFDEATELAKAFCAAEPTTVLAHVEATESKWSLEASQPGEEYLVKLLTQYRASWAIIRQWTGLDPVIAQREERIRNLERLVWDAVYALLQAGLDSEAHRLRYRISRA